MGRHDKKRQNQGSRVHQTYGFCKFAPFLDAIMHQTAPLWSYTLVVPSGIEPLPTASEAASIPLFYRPNQDL